jgi:hypothetical protein
VLQIDENEEIAITDQPKTPPNAMGVSVRGRAGLDLDARVGSPWGPRREEIDIRRVLGGQRGYPSALAELSCHEELAGDPCSDTAPAVS